MTTLPFQAVSGGNQLVTTGAASASVTVKTPTKSVRVVNTGSTNVGHVRVGSGTQTATTADIPVLPGESLVLHKADDDETVAYIQAASGTTTMQIQPGQGGV